MKEISTSSKFNALCILTGLMCILPVVSAVETKPNAKSSVPPAPITGTISNTNAILSNAIGTGATTPARFAGIMFELKEHPGRHYIFKSPSFEHQGRNLLSEDLKGLTVRLVCEPEGDDPSAVESNVQSLTWVPPPVATQNSSPQSDPKAATVSVGERILGDPDIFSADFARQVRAAAAGEGLAVPAPCPEMAKLEEKYGNADSVKVEVVKVKGGPTVMLALHYYGDIGLGVANERVMAVLKK
ncbi:MAG: hypothetical protein PSU94_17235 [Lacunisphaera sp.]|nr:hypothetical protein [Lacunisphaera sp.]